MSGWMSGSVEASPEPRIAWSASANCSASSSLRTSWRSRSRSPLPGEWMGRVIVIP